MKKRFLVTLMAMCMVLSLAACGNNSGDNGSEVPVSSEDGEEDANEEVTEDTEKKEHSDDASNSEESKEQESSDEQQTSNQDFVVDSEYANLPESEGFVFESNGDGTCAITGMGGCSDEEIVIPQESPEGDVVTMIGESAFYNTEDIKTIVLAGKTIEIDEKAFQSCDIEKIIITGCDVSIGEYAFSYCENVTDIYVSNSTINVDGYAFYECGNDISVQIENCTGTLDKTAFQSSAILGLSIKASTLELGEYAFSYCEDMETILMENSDLLIDSYAFYEAGDDTAFSFSNCKLEMEDAAFQSGGFVSVDFADCETTMGKYVFSYCDDLTDFTVDANNTQIGEYTFYECGSLKNVSIAAESDMDDISIVLDNNALQTCAVENVVIGRGEIEIGDYAFSYCDDIISVELKGNLAEMGDYVFYECPDELVIMYDGTDYNKDSIQEVN